MENKWNLPSIFPLPNPLTTYAPLLGPITSATYD